MFTGYLECVGLTGEYLMMMKTMIMLSSGVVTKTGAHAYQGDMTNMGQNVKASALCKNGSNFQILMHEANFPLQKKSQEIKICQELGGIKFLKIFD